MKKTRLFSILFSTFILLGILGMPVQAANTQDTYFIFNLSGDSWNYTEGRAKENTTTVYVDLYDAPITYVYAQTQGYRVSWYNDTGSVSKVILELDVPSSIHNWIYERGSRAARLAIQQYTIDGYSSGAWSPDSTRLYHEVN